MPGRQNADYWALFFLWGLAIFAIWSVSNHVFFWDTIQLGSKHAHWFYDNNFKQLLLPESIDSGHPPIFGMYLAIMWKFFGKNLVISHLAMLPFVLGLILFLLKIARYFVGRKEAFILTLLCLADPVLSTQLLLISPDVVLVFFFLFGLYNILYDQPWRWFAALGLAVISLRGMMVVVILFLFDFVQSYFSKKQPNPLKLAFAKTRPYWLSGLVALFFLGYHYVETGWLGYHSDSPWSTNFARSEFKDALINVGILGWRLLDFGRVVVWLLLFISIFYYRKNLSNSKLDLRLKQVFWLFLLSLSLLSLTFILYKGLQAHRYLLPAFLTLNFFCFLFIVHTFYQAKIRNLLFGIWLVAYLSGNFWIYPDKIAQGWDASLAHLPYYKLRGEMLTYIDEKNIPLEEIGTAFPEIGPLKYKDLSESNQGMSAKELDQDKYIFYSNIMNDFTDSEIDELQNWVPLKILKRHGIKVILYQKKD